MCPRWSSSPRFRRSSPAQHRGPRSSRSRRWRGFDREVCSGSRCHRTAAQSAPCRYRVKASTRPRQLPRPVRLQRSIRRKQEEANPEVQRPHAPPSSCALPVACKHIVYHARVADEVLLDGKRGHDELRADVGVALRDAGWVAIERDMGLCSLDQGHGRREAAQAGPAVLEQLGRGVRRWWRHAATDAQHPMR
jgi:hypothetical protein